MIRGMGCQREEVRWEDKWAGSASPEYCGGISELWPNFSSRHFPCLLPFHCCPEPGTWELACLHFTGKHTEAQGG